MHSWFYKWGYKATRKKVKEIEPFKPDYKALFDLLLEKEVSESLDLENLHLGFKIPTHAGIVIIILMDLKSRVGVEIHDDFCYRRVHLKTDDQKNTPLDPKP